MKQVGQIDLKSLIVMALVLAVALVTSLAFASGDPCIARPHPVCDGGECPPGLLCLPLADDERCECQEELLVTLDTFTAEASADGVRLTWTTSAEIDNVGFRVLRVQQTKGQATDVKSLLPQVRMVSAELILAQGGPTRGAEYKFIDTAPPTSGPVAYYLEDVDVFGKATLHGPVTLVLGDTQTKPRARAIAD